MNRDLCKRKLTKNLLSFGGNYRILFFPLFRFPVNSDPTKIPEIIFENVEPAKEKSEKKAAWIKRREEKEKAGNSNLGVYTARARQSWIVTLNLYVPVKIDGI